MKIVFVQRGFENLAVEYLSASLKKAGHNTSLVFDPNLFGEYFLRNSILRNSFGFKKTIIREILESFPGMLAFSVVSNDYLWAAELAGEIKKYINVPVVFGGIHPSSAPEYVIRDPVVNYVCVGEGEEALVELADALEKNEDTKRIKNIWSKSGGKIYANEARMPVKLLDILPFPDKEIFAGNYPGFGGGVYKTMASRGCLLNCSYCFNSSLRKIYRHRWQVRKRSVDNLIEELKIAKSKYDRIKRVVFLDSVFTFDGDWLANFALKYRREVSLPFTCHVHPLTINKSIVRLLTLAGCTAVSMGVQNVDPAVRKNLFFRQESDEVIRQSIRLIKETKIFLYLDLIFGIPPESGESIYKLIDFFDKGLFPDELVISWINYYPNTDIVALARKLGYIDDNDVQKSKKGENFYPPNVGVHKFQKNTAKNVNLLRLFYFFPRKFIKLLIRKRIGFLFPGPSGDMAVHACTRIAKKILRRKSGVFYFFPGDIVRMYVYFLIRKLIPRRKSRRP